MLSVPLSLATLQPDVNDEMPLVAYLLMTQNSLTRHFQIPTSKPGD